MLGAKRQEASESETDGDDGGLDLVHFIIDTGRSGRGPLAAARFAAAPYGQPPEVIQGPLRGGWCNPPDAGLGPRPTADTGLPLVDAFVWAKTPGGSDGSCDIAGGARAWDYVRYNPWGIGGDARSHFDPLWGTVDPAAGEWFPEAALRLALNARPPLEVSGPTGPFDPTHAGRPARSK
jgi:endoglucanase